MVADNEIIAREMLRHLAERLVRIAREGRSLEVRYSEATNPDQFSHPTNQKALKITVEWEESNASGRG